MPRRKLNEPYYTCRGLFALWAMFASVFMLPVLWITQLLVSALWLRWLFTLWSRG